MQRSIFANIINGNKHFAHERMNVVICYVAPLCSDVVVVWMNARAVYLFFIVMFFRSVPLFHFY